MSFLQLEIKLCVAATLHLALWQLWSLRMQSKQVSCMICLNNLCSIVTQKALDAVVDGKVQLVYC